MSFCKEFFHCAQAVLWHPVVRVSQDTMPVNGHLFAKEYFLLLQLFFFFCFCQSCFFLLHLDFFSHFFFRLNLLFAKASFCFFLFFFLFFLFLSPHNLCASWHWRGRGSSGAYSAPFDNRPSTATAAWAWAFHKACRFCAAGRTLVAASKVAGPPLSLLSSSTIVAVCAILLPNPTHHFHPSPIPPPHPAIPSHLHLLPHPWMLACWNWCQLPVSFASWHYWWSHCQEACMPCWHISRAYFLQRWQGGKVPFCKGALFRLPFCKGIMDSLLQRFWKHNLLAKGTKSLSFFSKTNGWSYGCPPRVEKREKLKCCRYIMKCMWLFVTCTCVFEHVCVDECVNVLFVTVCLWHVVM